MNLDPVMIEVQVICWSQSTVVSGSSLQCSIVWTKGNLHATFNAQAFQRESNCNLWQRKTHPILQKLKLKNLLGRISCWVLRIVCAWFLCPLLLNFLLDLFIFGFRAPFSFPILSQNSYLDHSCIGLALLGKKSWCFWCAETPPPIWCFRVGVLSCHATWISCTIHIDLLVRKIETAKIQ
jgi:hypothetical protein